MTVNLKSKKYIIIGCISAHLFGHSILIVLKQLGFMPGFIIACLSYISGYYLPFMFTKFLNPKIKNRDMYLTIIGFIGVPLLHIPFTLIMIYYCNVHELSDTAIRNFYLSQVIVSKIISFILIGFSLYITKKPWLKILNIVFFILLTIGLFATLSEDSIAWNNLYEATHITTR